MDHQHLRAFLGQRVQDGVITKLIGKWLKAGVLEGGTISYNEAGSPQGGVISPLLSNIYLHEVPDKWFTKVITPLLKGKSVIVRFADDSVLGFENREDAERVFKVLPKRFARFGLQLHPDKTRLINFSKPPEDKGTSTWKRDTFNFLGFTFYWSRTRKGKWTVLRKTAKDRLRRSLRRINDWCKASRHQRMAIQCDVLNAKLRGHYQYFGVTGNFRSLQLYRFNILFNSTFILERPKIYHSIYAANP